MASHAHNLDTVVPADKSQGWRCSKCSRLIRGNAFSCSGPDCYWHECTACVKGLHPHPLALVLEPIGKDILTRCDLCNSTLNGERVSCPSCPQIPGYDECLQCFQDHHLNSPPKHIAMDDNELWKRTAAALRRVKSVLGPNGDLPVTPALDLPAEAQAGLAEWLTQTLPGALLACLEAMGARRDALADLAARAEDGLGIAVLCLRAQQRCTLQDPPDGVEGGSAQGGKRGLRALLKRSKSPSLAGHTWAVTTHWKLSMRVDVGRTAHKLCIAERECCTLLQRALTEPPPCPEECVHGPFEGQVGWLLRYTRALCDGSGDSAPAQDVDKCIQALLVASQLYRFADRVCACFEDTLFPVQRSTTLDIANVHAHDVFVPVLPLCVPQPGKAVAFLSPGDASLLVKEQTRSLHARLGQLRLAFPNEESAGVICQPEVCLVATLRHMQVICDHFKSGLRQLKQLNLHKMIPKDSQDLNVPGLHATPGDGVVSTQRTPRTPRRPHSPGKSSSSSPRRPAPVGGQEDVCSGNAVGSSSPHAKRPDSTTTPASGLHASLSIHSLLDLLALTHGRVYVLEFCEKMNYRDLQNDVRVLIRIATYRNACDQGHDDVARELGFNIFRAHVKDGASMRVELPSEQVAAIALQMAEGVFERGLFGDLSGCLESKLLDMWAAFVESDSCAQLKRSLLKDEKTRLIIQCGVQRFSLADLLHPALQSGAIAAFEPLFRVEAVSRVVCLMVGEIMNTPPPKPETHWETLSTAHKGVVMDAQVRLSADQFNRAIHPSRADFSSSILVTALSLCGMTTADLDTAVHRTSDDFSTAVTAAGCENTRTVACENTSAAACGASAPEDSISAGVDMPNGAPANGDEDSRGRRPQRPHRTPVVLP
mmetsp:Transcript_7057/g.17862  ORF Transcript_7057/g.17862 Transcript_7057/m.17862 type:complete len:880 (+) Transcript_7057:129-2768(+)